MEITGTTGLIIAAAAAGAATLLGKKSAPTACPPGSTRDAASGQCVVVRTVEVQVNGPSGQQANTGGESEVSKLTYEYNLQARSQWEKEAAQYAGDASIAAEFGAVMTLIQASTLFPDTPAGKASVDLLTKQIQAAFDRIDATRARNAQLRTDKSFGDDRLSLATSYDAAASAARNGLTDFSGALKATFLASKDVVDYYLNKKFEVLDAVGTIAANYRAVANVLNLPAAAPYQGDKWPSVLAGQLGSVGFAVPASRLSSIVPPSGKTDLVLSGLPKLPGQLAGIRTNFALYNSWGAIAASLKDIANPQSNTGGRVDYLSALGRGPGAIYCGRAVAVVMAARVLGELEKEINKLEVLAHIFDAGYQAVKADIDFARGVEQSVNGGDGVFSSTTMRRTIDTLAGVGGTVWRPYNGQYPENKSKDYIRQHTFMWLNEFRWREEPLPISAALKAQWGSNVPDRAFDLFTMSPWGMPDAAALKARFSALFDLLTSWQKMISIVDVDYALDDTTAPNSSAVGAKGLDLSLVAGCGDAAIPFTPPDYKTLTTNPDMSKIARNATSVDDDTGLVGAREALRSDWSASFNGLRGLNNCKQGCGMGRAKSSSVTIRESGVPMDTGPLRVSIGERVAVRGSGVGGLGSIRRGGSLGGLGALGDPIQQILSPLMGLNGRRRY